MQEALDYIPKAGLRWVGNCNELNAGYAADGYARIKGISALVTTFGVGELSALNAIAGAYSEFVPVIHIVGAPSTTQQRDGLLLHHTLGNGNFQVFKDMSRGISCAVVDLNDPLEAATLIDHAILECWHKSRPVYLSLPTDIVHQKVEGERLKTPLDLRVPDNKPEEEDYVVDIVLKHLHVAKDPIILVDACAMRHHTLDEVHELVQKSGLPTFVAPMGKGAINETLSNYGGVYGGSGSNPSVSSRVESSDLVLSIGAVKSDFNTSGFTYRVSQLSSIDFHSEFIRIKYSEYPGIRMKGVLKKVTQRLGKLNVQPAPEVSTAIAPEDQEMSENQPLTHAWLWPRLSSWLKPKDIVVVDSGTSEFGIWNTKFPEGVTEISQVLWGSIGYSVGACQGAALAAKETGDRRTVLFVGDGSFELTAQEVSTMIRHNLNPIMFVP